MTIHAYETTVRWSGRTDDYESYVREHTVSFANARSVQLTADPAFRGDPALPNPEALLLAAASSCQLLSFLAVAARSGLVVESYEDDASAVMPEDDRPVRLTEIILRPRITVRDATVEKVERLLAKAHGQCYIANSLTTRITIQPEITVAV